MRFNKNSKEHWRLHRKMKIGIVQKELDRRNLPDLLIGPNHVSINTKEEWEKVGRPYWKKVLLQEEYGKIPPVLNPTIAIKKQPIDFAGKAIWEEVTFNFQKGEKSHKIPTQLIYPTRKEVAPFFIFINFCKEVPNKYLPIEEIIDNGFGVFTVFYEDVTSDDADFSNGLAGLFQETDRQGDDCGKIMYWSWMASRMMDYLSMRREADKNKIGVVGHSRLGKTALLTAALDDRFCFVCSNNSGCSGAALSRGRSEGGESVRDICRQFPYWFCPNYVQYADKENEAPFDQHCLLALVAPRKAYIGAALEDVWADNLSQFLNCVAASKVWRLYEKEGFEVPDDLPKCGDKFIDGDVGFHLREGKHYFSRTDWLIYMEAIQNAINK